MPNQNQAPPPPENMVKAFELLRERAKPAVLDQTVNQNGVVMGRHIIAMGYNVFETDAQTLADLMYQVCCAQADQLKWTVLPAKLKLRQENNVATIKDEGNFADKVRANADAAEAKKLNDKARGVTAGIISQMKLSTLGKTANFQRRLHARVERAVKQGIAWTAIETDIRDRISALYAADEKSQERVGHFVDALSEVEV